MTECKQSGCHTPTHPYKGGFEGKFCGRGHMLKFEHLRADALGARADVGGYQ